MFAGCIIYSAQNYVSVRRSGVPSHGHGGVDTLSLRILSLSRPFHRALSPDRFYVTAGGAHSISSRFVRRLLAASPHSLQALGSGFAPYRSAISFLSPRCHRVPVSNRAVTPLRHRLLRPALSPHRQFAPPLNPRFSSRRLSPF